MATSNIEINDLIAHTNALHCSDPPSPILEVSLNNQTLPPSFILVGKLISLKPVPNLLSKVIFSKLGSS